MSKTSPVRRPAARRGEGDRLRAEIVEVTARLLEKSGDAGTLSLRAIAREVGVAATSIYLHFDSLQALLRAVKEEKYAEFSAACRAAIESAADDPRSRLRALTEAYVDFALERPGTYKVLFATTMNLNPSDPTPGQEAQDLVFAAMRETGGSEQEVSMAVTQMWCALHGMVTLRSDHRRYPWPERDAQLDDLVERMLPA